MHMRRDRLLTRTPAADQGVGDSRSSDYQGQAALT